MKTKSILALAALSVVFVNCTREELAAPANEQCELTAIMESDAPSTRAGVTEEGAFIWAEGDAISVFTSGGKVKGTLSSGAGESTATFQYSLIGDVAATGYAVYPHHSDHSISDNTLSVTLPSSYAFGAEMDNTNAIMAAVPAAEAADEAESSSYSFKHLGGVFRFVFKNVPAGVDNFVLSLGGSKICGVFTSDLSVDDPVVVTSATEEAAEQSVKLTFTALAETSDLTLFVPVPTGTYTGISASLNAGSESKWSYSSNNASNTISRRSLKAMPTITIQTATGDIEGTGAHALQEALNNGGKVEITEDITVTTALTIPEGVTVELNLNGFDLVGTDKIINTGVLTVQNGASLTISGEGTVSAVGSYPVKVNGGSVTIESGNFTATNSTQAVYVSSGSAVINGGYFEVDSEYNGKPYKEENGNAMYLLNCYDTNYKNGTATITVSGGTFVNFNPDDNVAEGAGTSFLAEGYAASQATTDGGDNLYSVVEAEYVADGVYLTEDGVYKISNEAGLRWVSEQVNTNTNKFEGKTVRLMKNLTLTQDWIPMGNTMASYPSYAFAGTFDGNNKTISNITANSSEPNYACSAFIGALTGHVKDLTLENVKVTSTHYAGGIVAYCSTNNSTITNCHVNGGTITSQFEEVSAGSWDNGDKAGGILGYGVAGEEVSGCSVKNVTIQGYRDLGGIIGNANGAMTIKNNTIENVNVVLDLTHDYKASSYLTQDDYDLGSIIGDDAGATTDGNSGTAAFSTVGGVRKLIVRKSLTYDSSKYYNVYLYTWGSDGTGYSGDWPGTKMTWTHVDDSYNYYAVYVAVPDSFNYIVNEGSDSAKTADLNATITSFVETIHTLEQ